MEPGDGDARPFSEFNCGLDAIVITLQNKQSVVLCWFVGDPSHQTRLYMPRPTTHLGLLVILNHVPKGAPRSGDAMTEDRSYSNMYYDN